MTTACDSKEGVTFALEPSMQNSGGIHGKRNQKPYSGTRSVLVAEDPLVAAPHVVLYSSSWSQKIARPEPQRHQEEQIIISR